MFWLKNLITRIRYGAGMASLEKQAHEADVPFGFYRAKVGEQYLEQNHEDGEYYLLDEPSPGAFGAYGYVQKLQEQFQEMEVYGELVDMSE